MKGSRVLPHRARQQKIIVVFRNDDPSARSEVEHERRIASYFEEVSCPQTIGVVPMFTNGDPHDPRDQDVTALDENPAMVSFLGEYAIRTGSELALHGQTHRTNHVSMPRRREYTEFRGLPFVEQETKIGRATEVFYRCFGCRPTTFIPPWNRMDDNTVRACAANGYRVVSAGPYTLSGYGITSLGMNCSLSELPERLRGARSAGSSTVLIVNYHSPTLKSPGEIRELREVLQLVAEAGDCEVLTLDQAAERLGPEVETYNRAGKNIAIQTEVDGNRASAFLYDRVAGCCRITSRLTNIRSDACKAYLRGEFATAAALSGRIDRLSSRMKWIGRTTMGFMGVILALALLHFLSAATTTVLSAWTLSGSVGIVLVGGGAWYGSTSRQTRTECLIATASMLLGHFLGLCVHLIIHFTRQ